MSNAIAPALSGQIPLQTTSSSGNSLTSDQMPIISFSELTNIIDVIRSREQEDKLKLVNLENVNEDTIRENLKKWAMSQFEDNHTFYVIQFSILDTCSDGVVRNNVFEYMTYLNPGFSLPGTLANLEQRLPGMRLSYSYTSNLTLYIHVSKK